MGVVKEIDRRIDVICQHERGGGIIPLKIRLVDEDGLVQQYMVKSYREITAKKEYTTPSGVRVTSVENIRKFECKIEVFHREKTICILYNPRDQIFFLGN